MRSDKKWIIVALIIFLILVGAYVMFGTIKEKPVDIKQDDIEYMSQNNDDDFEIIEASEEPAFQVGFGMGQGVYGSGRHTSEMVGN